MSQKPADDFFDATIWRPATADDLPSIHDISIKVHPDLPERHEVLAEKFALFPQGCFLLARGCFPSGYAIAHPWTLYDVPALDSFLIRLPPQPDCLYLHDVALLPSARGDGQAQRLIEKLVSLARTEGLGRLALTSVYGTHRLWGALGFQDSPAPIAESNCASYGDQARYMIRTL